MRTGIVNTAYFGLTGAKEGFRKLKTHGFDCADYHNLSNTDTELFSCNEKAFITRMKADRAAADAVGVEINQTHGPWCWPPPDKTPEERAYRLEQFRRCVLGTALLGARNMVVHPLMPFGLDDSGHEQESMDINLEFYAALLETARDYHVCLCFENMPMPDLSLGTMEAAVVFAQKMADPLFGICLDTGHCAVCSQSPADAVKQAGSFLKVLHVHDNNGKYDFHWLPYNGIIDWAAFTIALKEIGFQGVLSLETAISGKLPADTREYFQKGLFLIAKHLAE